MSNTFAAEFSRMPVLKPCATPGCPLLIEGQGFQRPSHCLKHRQERARAFGAKRTSGEGYTYRWQQVSKMVLRRDPVCSICNRNPSTETDHIIPKVEGGTDHPDTDYNKVVAPFNLWSSPGLNRLWNFECTLLENFNFF